MDVPDTRSLMLFLSSIVMSCFVCHALCVTGCDLSASAVLYAHDRYCRGVACARINIHSANTVGVCVESLVIPQRVVRRGLENHRASASRCRRESGAQPPPQVYTHTPQR